MKCKKLMVFSVLLLLGIGSELLFSLGIKLSERAKVLKLNENSYIHISYSEPDAKYPNCPANGLIYVSGNHIFVVDTPWTNQQTKLLINWMENFFKKRVAAFIITHWHVDCMGGLEEVNRRGIKSYALDLTHRIIKTKKLPIPTDSFKRSMTLGTGENVMELSFPGAGHTVDNIIVWLPKDKILYAGCIVKAKSWNSLGHTSDGDVNLWPQSLENILKKYSSARIVIPGHGEHGGLDIVEHTLSLLKDR